jgi:hypothetical protein
MQRWIRLAAGIPACLTACAPTRPLPPVPQAALRPSIPATVVAYHPLAAPEFRAAVLISLTGAAAPPVSVPGGAELVVQTPDGRTLTCIAHGTRPPRIGATVALQNRPDCEPAVSAPADIAVAGAIR